MLDIRFNNFFWTSFKWIVTLTFLFLLHQHYGHILALVCWRSVLSWATLYDLVFSKSTRTPSFHRGLDRPRRPFGSFFEQCFWPKCPAHLNLFNLTVAIIVGFSYSHSNVKFHLRVFIFHLPAWHLVSYAKHCADIKKSTKVDKFNNKNPIKIYFFYHLFPGIPNKKILKLTVVV